MVVVHPDPLSPIPSTALAMKTPVNIEEGPDDPEPADEGYYFTLEQAAQAHTWSRDGGGGTTTTTSCYHDHYMYVLTLCGACGGTVIKALHYKPAGRGFDSRWCHWNFSVT
jgi:hypothetical protein